MASLCLNMIVRDEAANLERCLTALAPHIGSWVICDTGSRDGTPEFIRRFFAQRGIPGELHQFPFQNFGQARNEALERARVSSLGYDYLLLADADMELVVENGVFSNGLSDPAYRLIQRNETIEYRNTRLLRRDVDARYVGVTHEYLAVKGTPHPTDLDGAWFSDHETGANRQGKLDRDIRLLEKAIANDLTDARSWYYLAQSYRDSGRHADAARVYEARVRMGGWDEEVWSAQLEAARCYRRMGDAHHFIAKALRAFAMRPSRAEPLSDLATYFREQGSLETGLMFAARALQIQKPADLLFVEPAAYGWRPAQEYAICGYFTADKSRRRTAHDLCNRLALDRGIHEPAREAARRNLFQYAGRLSEYAPSLVFKRLEFAPPSPFRPNNSSVLQWRGSLLFNARCTNHFIDYEGTVGLPDGYVHFPPCAPMMTRNFMFRLNDDLSPASEPLEITLPEGFDDPATPVLGLEDIRLFGMGDELWCSGSHLEGEWIRIVTAQIEGGGFTRISTILPKGITGRHEKNWMPVIDAPKPVWIYSCDPLLMVNAEGDWVKSCEMGSAIDNFRGGSQAIPFDGGHLCLIHEKHVEGTRQNYQHRFFWFSDGQATASRRFWFLQKGVAEFVAGMAWHPDGERLVISFGLRDREAWLAAVDADDVRRMLFTDGKSSGRQLRRSRARGARPDRRNNAGGDRLTQRE